MRYAIVIEKAPSNYAAYVPDLAGCVVTGNTVEETESLIREAIEFHLEGLKADGLPIPPPSSQVEYIQVYAAHSEHLDRVIIPEHYHPLDGEWRLPFLMHVWYVGTIEKAYFELTEQPLFR